MYYLIPQNELYHHGILGQKWGIRRYQNKDGTLTEAGKKRYGTVENLEASRTKKIGHNIKKNRDIVKNEINQKLKEYGQDLYESDNKFNNLGNELAKDYDNYYNQISKDSNFRHQMALKIGRENNWNLLDQSFEDAKWNAVYDHDFLYKDFPNSVRKKEEEFWKTGDQYFKIIDDASKSVVKKYENIPISDTYGFKTRVTDATVRNMIDSSITHLGFNAYMYRHYYDYWVSQGGEGPTKVYDSLSYDDYKKVLSDQLSKE